MNFLGNSFFIKSQVFGLIKEPFSKNKGREFEENFLYYENSRLTNKYFIMNPRVYIKGEFQNEGIHKVYAFGTLKKGSYITTSPLYGVVIEATKETGFAIAQEDKNNYEVDLINVKFL